VLLAGDLIRTVGLNLIPNSFLILVLIVLIRNILFI